MNAKWVFAAIGLLASMAGVALWLAADDAARPEVTPTAAQVARFTDGEGRSHTLGQFQGQVVVVNFWATWCAPCREEIPGFVRLQQRWAGRGVSFVGLANDERTKVEQFAADFHVNYPLWTGGDEVMELSRALGNRLGVLPHTVILGPAGELVQSRIGVYGEADLEQQLRSLTAKSS